MTDSNHDHDQTRLHVTFTTGTVVGHYRIEERLGAGGMGEVYLAEDTTLFRRAALKFLPTQFSRNEEIRSRFIREARSAAKLSHPNIVVIHEVGEHDGQPYFAMEYVEGATLKSISREGSLSLARIGDIVRQCAEALAEAHRNGVVHRDIKPTNIVVDRSGRARLLDFGLALVHDGDSMTQPGAVMGTFAYMSPEQTRGEKCDGRSDLFSLGVVWYELITGESPFARDNTAATLHAVNTHQPPQPTHGDAPIPESLWSIMAKLLEKSADDRPQSADELVEMLRGLNETDDVSADAPPSIAILPFANMSEDPSQEHFCDGIAEDIINDLTRLESLRVVARTSAFAFKGKNEDLRIIGRKLNVETILEGSVRKAGQRLRVTAQLINVADGFHLWSERYDREITDIFAIQDDISRNVVGKLVGLLLPPTDERSMRSVDIEVYDLYNRGRYHLRLRTADGFAAALECFREVVARQPDYVHGYVGLADTHFLQYAYELVEPRNAVSRARWALLRALELDPNNAEAYATLGSLLTFHDWAWDEAEEAFKKSISLNPGYAVGQQWYGELLSILGRIEEAEARFRKAHELDPLADIVLIMHAVAVYIAGRIDGAIGLLEEAIAMGSKNENAYTWLGFCQIGLGQHDEGMSNMKKALEISGNSVFSTVMYGHACALVGDRDGLERAAGEIAQRATQEYVGPGLRSVLAWDLGEKEEAYSWLRDAIRCHNSEAMIMSVVPYYQEMRADPTVRTLLGVLALLK